MRCIGHHPLHPVGKAPCHSHSAGSDQCGEQRSQQPETNCATVPACTGGTRLRRRACDVCSCRLSVETRDQETFEIGEIARRRVAWCLECHVERPLRCAGSLRFAQDLSQRAGGSVVELFHRADGTPGDVSDLG